jgi:hypothetical protein
VAGERVADVGFQEKPYNIAICLYIQNKAPRGIAVLKSGGLPLVWQVSGSLTWEFKKAFLVDTGFSVNPEKVQRLPEVRLCGDGDDDDDDDGGDGGDDDNVSKDDED